MRVAVLFFGAGKRDGVLDLARGIAESLEKSGHQVDLIDGEREAGKKLTAYEYLAVGTAVTSSFGGRIAPSVAEFLSQSGILGGKKSFAFILKAPLGSQKALARLMRTMEQEGLFLRFSETLRSREEAAEVARRLKLER